jgi:hypothetical protein
MIRTMKVSTAWWTAANAPDSPPGGIPRGSIYKGG